MRRFLLVLAAVLASALAPAASAAADPDRVAFAARRLRETVEQLGAAKGGLQGYAVVVVTPDATPLLYVRGLADAAKGTPATPDTQFYVASMTKSFVGLLAARLDRENVLDIDQPLSAYWPGLERPGGVDPSKVTLKDLLAHNGGFDNDPLAERAAYTDPAPGSQYVEMLNRFSRPTPGYTYSNLGYQIYGEVLRERTGRDWRAWLDRAVTGPMGLTGTSSLSSRVPPQRLAAAHQWTGAAWATIPPKKDLVMHAAGGHFISARDLAAWMRAHLVGRAEGVPGLGPEVFALAHAKAGDMDSNAASDAAARGFRCDAYALGWQLCAYQGARVLQHGGTYTGFRSQMTVSPELGAGVGFMANSDSQTGRLNYDLTALFFDYLMGRPEADAKAAGIVKAYLERAPLFGVNRMKAVERERAKPVWGGWSWKPSARELQRYAGVYASPRWGRFVVTLEQGRLVARSGGFEAALQPAAPDVFAVNDSPADPPRPLVFRRAGPILGFVFDDRAFWRD